MTVVVLSPARPGRYDVQLDDEVVVRGSRDPEHDAARALLARGIVGPMTTTRAGGMVCMRFDIETAAQFTIAETDEGFKVRRWRPFPAGPVGARTRSFELVAVE